MSRTARLKSKSGIYHVMMRGIDKRNIFLAEDDYKSFLNYIKKAREKGKFSLLAYCLMTNHVHLLVKEGPEELGNSIRRIAVGYAQYHNIKNGRTGHLFQNRFASEPVNDDKYLLVVTRYIHRNPVKAGLVKKLSDYRWSSYIEFLSDKGGIVDREIVMNYFSSIEAFSDFNTMASEDQCLDFHPRNRYKDDDLKQIIEKFTVIRSLHQLDKKEKCTILRKIKNETGASTRQLERVLGISRHIIQKA